MSISISCERAVISIGSREQLRREADRDLDGIFEWIAKDNPRAAVEIRRTRAKLDLLATGGFGEIGRAGRDNGTRELIVNP